MESDRRKNGGKRRQVREKNVSVNKRKEINGKKQRGRDPMRNERRKEEKMKKVRGKRGT